MMRGADQCVCARAGATVEQFEQAKEKLSSLQKDPGNEVKLKIYALFKQVGASACKTRGRSHPRHPNPPLSSGHSGSLQHAQTRHAGLYQQGQMGRVEISGLLITGSASLLQKCQGQ